MKRSSAPDHLSSSLTDMMTSLAVIFILLLVAKLNHEATRTERSMTFVVDQLESQKMFNGGEKMRRDGDVIVVAIPQELMSFKQATAARGGADLSPQGKEYLRNTVPKLASVLCRDDVRSKIDAILVEGHSDRKGFGKATEQADKEENLKLSQQRSMSVVEESLTILGDNRGCFLELLSATGRGDAKPLNVTDIYSPENRRVELRIRVKPDAATSVSKTLSAPVRAESSGAGE
jgi:flagellar motor protein MotB